MVQTVQYSKHIPFRHVLTFIIWLGCCGLVTWLLVMNICGGFDIMLIEGFSCYTFYHRYVLPAACNLVVGNEHLRRFWHNADWGIQLLHLLPQVRLAGGLQSFEQRPTVFFESIRPSTSFNRVLHLLTILSPTFLAIALASSVLPKRIGLFFLVSLVLPYFCASARHSLWRRLLFSGPPSVRHLSIGYPTTRANDLP